MRPHLPAFVLLVAAYAAAGCVAPPVEREARCEPLAGHSLAGAEGHWVAPPSFVAFSGSLRVADDSGRSQETFRAVVFDADGEADFAGALLRLVVDGPEPRVAARVIARHSLNETREPAFGADGMKVWSGERGDGMLFVAAHHAYPTGAALGNYSITLEVTPTGGSTVRSPADATVVRAYGSGANATREPPAFAAPIAGAPAC